MVQFHVLRCAVCQTFQVLQVTKTAKWKCKMCGLKQSVTKVYGQGSGADCRRHVQKLNSIRCQVAKTAEEQHLIIAAQTPVDSGFTCPDVIFQQQETVRSSRWSSFVDESGDEVEESSRDVININGSVVPVTTDSTEYQGTRNNWRKRRADRSNWFSKLPGKKSKIFNENMNMPDATARVPHSVKYTENSTDFSVKHAFKSNTSSNLSSSTAYLANTLPVSSLANGKDTGSSKHSPYQCSARSQADGGSVAKIECPPNNTHDLNWLSRGLSKDGPVNVLGGKKERTNQNKTKENCKLTSTITGNSKWDAFLETEHHDDDDDDDVTFCEYDNNINILTDSKLQVVNSCSLSVAAGHFTQEKQFVDAIQKHSSVQYPRESDGHNNLDSQSRDCLKESKRSDWLKESKGSDWLKESKRSDWLKESKRSDWLKESKPSDWLKESKPSDWLKESKPSDWLSDPVVTRTADSNSAHSTVTSKERGTFDLGLEILDEDLQL